MDNALIPLEDTWLDVVKKAVRGLHFSEGELETQSGLSAGTLGKILSGQLREEDLRSLAPTLGLNPTRLNDLAMGRYHPGMIRLPEGIAMFTTPWHDFEVHSYLAWDPNRSGRGNKAVAFDTGSDASEMLSFLVSHHLNLEHVFLTHGHGDHVFDLDRIIEKTKASALQGDREETPGVQQFTPGKTFRIGSLEIETRSTWGHAKGGVTYLIKGLEKPVAIVGDAIFAGSMGGGIVSYAACLETNREEILSLPPETLICPGHGPLTTVALENLHNPFF
jgi:glyoxylase-like metal-dependent hydrolase (beta-lactamase superfamily II)